MSTHQKTPFSNHLNMSVKFSSLCLLIVIYQTGSQTVPCRGNCVCPTSDTGIPCILNCYGAEQCKDSALECRAGDACHVNCNGVNACEGNAFIDGSQSTRVTINCIGDNACKGNTVLNCGTDACTIFCGTESSCQNTRVIADDATSFQCIGNCESKSIPAPFVIPTHAPTPPTTNPTMFPSKSPSFSPSYSPTKIPTMTPTMAPSSLAPTMAPSHAILTTESVHSVNNSSTTASVLEIDGPLDSHDVNRTAMVIIGILSLGIVVVSVIILWILCARQSRLRKESEVFTQHHAGIKIAKLNQPVLSNYGATGIHELDIDDPLRSLHEDDDGSTLSDIDNSRILIDVNHGIETDALAAHEYIDDMLKKAHESEYNYMHLPHDHNVAPSYMYGVRSDAIPKIEYRPPIHTRMEQEDSHEVSHATVTTTDALSELKARGDLCCSSDNTEYEGSRSADIDPLSSQESDVNLDTACVDANADDQTISKMNLNDTEDDWLVKEINDTETTHEVDDVAQPTYVE
eukprot:16971_1